ncbi:ATPase family AAA domain-containing protein 2 isoform X1 [Diachasma alloeum]|uniref:ATPase family AAA domain-containing protein 2 isoform X1 n=1 Tax=Diachasma alloeum TaxID=454923 RepID=UPI0007381600|nr:ATPase family AAA domain-containing protein 2 isoform X1 [Diachasma alloeum]
MSDGNAAMDSMDSDEDIFSARPRRLSGRSTHRVMRTQPGVRRSTRNRMQTYDNLNTSWILGTQTLKGYPMFQNHASSSDKEMADDPPRDLRDRMPLRSRENHPPPSKSTRHIRDRSTLPRDRAPLPRDRPSLTEPESKNLRESRHPPKDLIPKITTRSKSEVPKSPSEEKEVVRTRKTDSPNRLREGPVTRLCGMLDKDEKMKSEPPERNDDSSQESEKPENNGNSDNDDGYEDMYTRIKRTRRTSQRQLDRSKKMSESDMSESSDSPGPRKYSLRQKKPTVDRFQANAEPGRRSIRALRSVLTNSMRRRKHRSKSSSSSDSDDPEPQRYDKKKGKKARQTAVPQGGPPDKKADISPITLDTNIRFNDVGGLESHIHCLKEMVVFPMMYPDVFDRFHITPPKGVLFHGPPGTGKTLIARALANECSQGSRKVAFFMRKGADCLSKWVGESERQLRLLFEQAQQMKPSIIFFDEIDGLAPVRSTKQDQIHASIVSTLLALMDGLSDRGEVIVIGATNRIDAIDPALRRPGRFDRELFFPLPAMKERLEILKIHVAKWQTPPTEELLQVLAEKTTGYCGSDLRALCTEAVLQGLRRTYPQIYRTSNRLLLDPQRVEVKKRDFIEASSILVPSSHRVAPSVSRKLQPFLIPLLGPALEDLVNAVKAIFPQGINPALAKIKVAKGIHRPRMLVTGDDRSHGQGPRLAQALLYRMEHVPVQTLDVSTLFAESARSPEETCVQVFNEASRNIPSIIYIRSIDQWWPLVPETVKAVFMCRIAALDPCLPILILATSDVDYRELPPKVKNLFSELRGEVYTMKSPGLEQREEFFRPIFVEQSLKGPMVKDDKVKEMEELPLAPDPMPKKLSEEEVKVLREKEEVSLRELRIFLREICAKLARNRQFFMFTKPVDTEEVPDYNSIIKQPMDLETMMTKIDMHCYLCARDFLDDVDLICRNALEYNPDSLRDRPSLGILKRDPADKLIRHRACSLRDNAYALIKAELDSDFEDKCREISKSRRAPEDLEPEGNTRATKPENGTNDSKTEKNSSPGASAVLNGRKLSTSRKRKVPAWARGYVKKVTKKKKIMFEENPNDSPPKGNNGTRVVDLEKFQEFEANAVVMNGDSTIYDNTESENESVNEGNHREVVIGSQVEVISDKGEKEGESKEEKPVEEKPVENGESHSSSRRESTDDLTFAVDCDSSPKRMGEEKVVVDEGELQEAWRHTVDVTRELPVEVLCDIYVQLSRCVGKYDKSYDRRTLPKDLLKELQRFENPADNPMDTSERECNG